MPQMCPTCERPLAETDAGRENPLYCPGGHRDTRMWDRCKRISARMAKAISDKDPADWDADWIEAWSLELDELMVTIRGEFQRAVDVEKKKGNPISLIPNGYREPPTTADQLLHRLWTKAVGTLWYHKDEWKALEGLLIRAGILKTPIDVSKQPEAKQ